MGTERRDRRVRPHRRDVDRRYASESGTAEGTAYTPAQMEMGTLGERRDVGFDALYAEAKEALSQGANHLRAVTERLRETYAGGHAEWQRTRESASDAEDVEPAARSEQQRVLDRMSKDLARGKAMLSRLELAVRDMEGGWLFLERGQDGPGDAPGIMAGVRGAQGERLDGTTLPMHILEAQEAERARLAAELHDGPAQALANAVFQTEVVDRSLERDAATARQEVRALRTLLGRELDQLRSYINQLRPILAEPSDLDGALRETASDLTNATGVPVEVRLDAPPDVLDDAHRTVVLRVAQEALRNIRKHAGANRAWLTTRLETDRDGTGSTQAWILEVGDDGRGFDPDEATHQASRRHFGLRFMRERAGLIGAGLDIDARPAAGTLVRLTIATG